MPKTTDPQPVSQGTSIRRTDLERLAVERRTAVHHSLALLRQAMADTGHTYDSLVAITGKSRSYLHDVLNGVKHCRLEFLVMLPRDMRARYCCLCAETHHYTVVKSADTEHALRHVVAVLLGSLKPQMAKADLREKNERVAV
jgi:hypothetical protein